MLDIEKVDHIGIRVSDKSVSIAFYERLGFRTLSDTGFEKGHPVIMQHPSGVVLNLLGPANTPNDMNILMDVDDKYPGIAAAAALPMSRSRSRPSKRPSGSSPRITSS